VKRQKGIAKATDKLTNEAGTPERLAMIRKAGEKINKEKKKAERDAKRAMAKDKDLMGEAFNSNDYAALEKKHDELAAHHSKEAKKHHDASDNNSDSHAAARKQHNNAAKHHEHASMMARAAKDVTSDSTYPSYKVAAVKSDYDNSANRAHRNSQRARDAATAANKSTNEAVNHDLYNSDTARKAHVGKVRARRQPDGSRLFYADVHNHVKAKAIGRKDTTVMISGASLGYKSRKHAKDIAGKMAHMMNTGVEHKRTKDAPQGRGYEAHIAHHKKYGNVEEATLNELSPGLKQRAYDKRHDQMIKKWDDWSRSRKKRDYGKSHDKADKALDRDKLAGKGGEKTHDLYKRSLGKHANLDKDGVVAASPNSPGEKFKSYQKSGGKKSYGQYQASQNRKSSSKNEAKSFDQKFRAHLKFATSKSPAVKAYLKKRAADRDAMNKELDPNAAKKGYALSAVPPERAFGKARKKGMSAAAASQAVGTASRNRNRKLPK